MADIRPFEGLSQEDTNTMLLMMMAQLLDKMPRIDSFDRVFINGSEVEALNTITQIGTSGRQRPADLLPFALPNMGALHIYNQIQVT